MIYLLPYYQILLWRVYCSIATGRIMQRLPTRAMLPSVLR